MKTLYFTKKVKKGNKKEYLLLSLGSIISYLAILDGIRDITKQNLRDWSQNCSFFNDQTSNEVINKYFNFLIDHNEIDILDGSWVKYTEYFIENFFKNKF